MRKNIAVFCDGTWQSLSQWLPTNVSCLARSVSPAQSDGCPQLVFYDDGVGVSDGVLPEATKLLGGGMGVGLDAKIAEVYQFLCLNYVPGDRIFIFGFSRGAYTARSLSGLLRKCWILKRDHIGSVDQAMAHYRSGELENPALAQFRQQNCYPMQAFVGSRPSDPAAAAAAINPDSLAHVQFIGVWDTVGSLGIPQFLPFARNIDAKYRFHDESLSRFVVSARHAVAVDERRSTFSPTLWDNIDDLNKNASADALPREQRPYQQIWFPGNHSGVGGGDDDHGLSRSPLAWIAEGAERAGLEWSKDILGALVKAADPLAPFAVSGTSFSDEVVRLMGETDRSGPAAFEDVSEPAKLRWRKLPAYRPKPLSRFAAELSKASPAA
jgi:uncharacterized protein (DUF2235 family)